MEEAFLELPGTVHAQYRKRGDRVYGPYWFRFWREGGKLRKVYVRKDELEGIRTLCHSRQNRHRERARGLRNLRGLRSGTRDPFANIAFIKEFFAVDALLERKEEHELTPLQRARVDRLLAALKDERA